MKKVILRHLTLADKDEFYSALNELWEENFDFLHYWESLGHESFETYVKILPELSKGNLIPKEHVPCTFFLAFDENNKIVGRVSIRHELNDHLLKVGGHIGYGVVPTFRRKGYATAILSEALNYIKLNLQDIKKVLVTCDDDNIGSIKTIERNGGVLENILEFQGEKDKRRYWIKL